MNGRVRNQLLAVGLAGAAMTAAADTGPAPWYLAPSIGYVFADNDRNADDGGSLGLALGRAVDEKWNVEYALRGNSLDRKAGGSHDQYGLGVDGLYFFKRDPAFAPFALVGAGVLRTDIPGSSDDSLMANAGLGFLKRLTDNIDLRADARYRWASNDLPGVSGDSLGDWLVSVGLNVALGRKAASTARPATHSAVAPKPIPQPMPAASPAPRPEPTPPGLARTSTTPVATPRVETPPLGAPVVATAAKPETKPETRLPPVLPPLVPAEVAQQLEQAKPGDVVVTLRGVNFDFDSARLRPEALDILGEAVRVLRQRDKLKVDIVGHTCSIGSHEYNQGLSERRAQSVYDFLVGNKLEAARFGVKGYGETRPAADNGTRAGREKNRRVELHVVE